jgi:hypothetical protein
MVYKPRDRVHHKKVDNIIQPLISNNAEEEELITKKVNMAIPI